MEAEILRETDRAILVQLEDGREEWLPRSTVDESAPMDNGMWQITIAGWKARELGLD